MTNTPHFVAHDVSLNDLTGDQLRARVARAQLYLVDMKPAEGAMGAPPTEMARDHLAYLYKLEKHGHLYGCGPLGSEGDEPAHDLAIIAARSREEADQIAKSRVKPKRRIA